MLGNLQIFHQGKGTPNSRISLHFLILTDLTENFKTVRDVVAETDTYKAEVSHFEVL